MPELPDIELYVRRLRERVAGSPLRSLRFYGPSVLRTVSPQASLLVGRQCCGVDRIGKRIVLHLSNDFHIVLHLMISGRLSWSESQERTKKPTGKIITAEFAFESGLLTLQEASTKKRASVHLVEGEEGLQAFERGGLDTLTAGPEEFRLRLSAENRTLKRALTNPAFFDGIGNAYSDEILFAARISPVRLTRSLTEEESARLLDACRSVLTSWRDRLPELYTGFPKPTDVTTFRPQFAVHGKFGKPCPQCGAPVQHIVYAENETNYCAKCQNEGRLLADRSLSRLLKDDWPKTLEEMTGG